MKQKILDAVADMESKVTRDRWHRYTDIDGRFLAGGSTIAGVLPAKAKQFLVPWAGKEAVKQLGFYGEIEGVDHTEDIARAEKIRQKIAGMTTKQYLALLKKAKGGAGRKSTDAMDLGKEGHSFLEEYVNAKINNTDLPDIEKWNDYPFIKNSIQEFIKWEQEEVVEWYLAEAFVCRLDNPLASEWDTPEELKGYAGQLDALALTKKGLTLIDFKFAKRISPEYFLQAVGYAKCFEPYGIDVPQRAIIRLPKTEFQEVYDPKTYKTHLEKDELEISWGDVARNDWDFSVFLHNRETLRWWNQVSK